MIKKENNRWEESLKLVPVDINKVEFVNRPKEENKEATDSKAECLKARQHKGM